MTILTDPVWFSYNHGHLGMKMYSTDALRSYRESLFSNDLDRGPGAIVRLAATASGHPFGRANRSVNKSTSQRLTVQISIQFFHCSERRLQ